MRFNCVRTSMFWKTNSALAPGCKLDGANMRCRRKSDREVATSKMAVSLTTNQTTYSPGQVVQMKLTMTNTSGQNETVALGQQHRWILRHPNAKVIWRSNSGVEPQYIVRRLLKPGQSITLTA